MIWTHAPVNKGVELPLAMLFFIFSNRVLPAWYGFLRSAETARRTHHSTGLFRVCLIKMTARPA